MFESAEAAERRYQQACITLGQAGWRARGDWRFQSPSGSVHDLSAADLGQLSRIEREGLFLVS